LEKRILIIEDDDTLSELVSTELRKKGFGIKRAASGQEADEWLLGNHADLMLLDYSLPDMNGQELIADFRKKGTRLPPFIVITGLGDERVAVDMMKAGARDYLIKDTKLLTLLPEIVSKALRDVETEMLLSKAQSDLCESEEKTRRLFTNELVSICIFESETGRLLDVNDAFVKLYGWTRDELLSGMTIFDVSGEKEKTAALIKGVGEGQDIHVPVGRRLKKDGSTFAVELFAGKFIWKGREVFYSMGMDIDARLRAEEERKILEGRLIHSQKLESMGLLASGIAHDFNNILMAVSGNADLIMMEIQDNSPIRDYVIEIAKASHRASELCRQLMTFAGKGSFSKVKVDLNAIIRDMAKMLEVSIPKKVKLKIDLASELPAIEADPSQIRQILLNLVINAAEAIGLGNGEVVVSTSVAECNREFLKSIWLHEELNEGIYISLKIIDNGQGMDQTALTKIFDPFYSTKFLGRGLGLAVVLGIVKRHNGALKVESEPGRGTTFQVLLPHSSSLLEDECIPEIPCREEKTARGTVMVVDDEATVLKLAGRILSKLGYGVISCGKGSEAVEIFRKNEPSIDVVVLDLTMPDMDGMDVYSELEKIRPGIKVLLSSGYSEGDVMSRVAGRGIRGFIQKPYEIETLRKKLGEIMRTGD